MSREDYEKVRGLVSRIDDVSNSADITRKIIDSFNKNGRKKQSSTLVLI